MKYFLMYFLMYLVLTIAVFAGKAFAQIEHPAPNSISAECVSTINTELGDRPWSVVRRIGDFRKI